MRFKTVLAAGVTLLAISGGAAAQEPSPPSGPSPETLEAVRAKGDALIAASGARDVFENVTSGGMIEIRHRPSGLVCLLEGMRPARNELIVITQTGLPRGDDVVCNSVTDTASYSTYFTRWPRQLSLQAEFNAVSGAIKAQFGRVRPWTTWRPPMTSEAFGVDNPPEAITGRFQVKVEGRDVFTRVTLAHIGPWSMKMRASSSMAEAELVNLLADSYWFISLRPLPPQPAGGGAS